MKSVQALMQRGVAEGVFPGGVLLAGKGTSVLFIEAFGWADLFSRKKMTPDTLFDLASLTKPLATALAVFHLHQEGRLHVDQPVSELLPAFRESGKGRMTLRDLLTHESGLPAYRPYYLTLHREEASKRKMHLRQMLALEPLEYPAGKASIYSDLGFMILEWVVESVSGASLDQYLESRVYARIRNPETGGLFFPSSRKPDREASFAATEFCTWRNRVLSGEVHDENAYVCGGVGGHAGLFGSAADVWRVLSGLLSDLKGDAPKRLFNRKLLERVFSPSPVGGRALGFDTPSGENPSCGRSFSERTFGHLGFTGTSFWMDLHREITVILLTNRIHPSRGNDKIRVFRPLLHGAVMEAIC